MNKEDFKPIKVICVISFIVVVVSSVPLLMSYFKGITLKYSFIVDLHVWAGIIFITVATVRMIRVKTGKQNRNLRSTKEENETWKNKNMKL